MAKATTVADPRSAQPSKILSYVNYASTEQIFYTLRCITKLRKHHTSCLNFTRAEHKLVNTNIALLLFSTPFTCNNFFFIFYSYKLTIYIIFYKYKSVAGKQGQVCTLLPSVWRANTFPRVPARICYSKSCRC